MSRRACFELYPDPRPSRLLAPFVPHLPRLLRLLPWLSGAPIAGAALLFLLSALPLVTWVILSAAVVAPLGAGFLIMTAGD